VTSSEVAENQIANYFLVTQTIFKPADVQPSSLHRVAVMPTMALTLISVIKGIRLDNAYIFIVSIGVGGVSTSKSIQGQSQKFYGITRPHMPAYCLLTQRPLTCAGLPREHPVSYRSLVISQFVH
jgi:hypothetical protein